MSISQPLAERFWKKVDRSAGDDGCWEWLAFRDRDGYGMFDGKFPDKKEQRAHRISWRLTFGPIPTGIAICHHCDNRSCVNPRHLFAGTTAENNRDMIDKGRERYPTGDEHWSRRRPDRVKRGDDHYARQQPEKVRRGESHPLARLTADDVRQIRKRSAEGATSGELGREYGVTYQHIHGIVIRRFWKSV